MSNIKPVGYRNKFTGMIWTLEQQPGAENEPDIYEPLVLQSDVLALVAERDALAAENCIQDFIITAIRDLVRDSEGVIGWHLNGDTASWDEVLPELSHSETPNTDAAIAEIGARAVGAEFNRTPDAEIKWDGTNLTVQNVRDGFSFGVTPVFVAANLRAGRKG